MWYQACRLDYNSSRLQLATQDIPPVASARPHYLAASPTDLATIYGCLSVTQVCAAGHHLVARVLPHGRCRIRRQVCHAAQVGAGTPGLDGGPAHPGAQSAQALSDTLVCTDRLAPFQLGSQGSQSGLCHERVGSTSAGKDVSPTACQAATSLWPSKQRVLMTTADACDCRSPPAASRPSWCPWRLISRCARARRATLRQGRLPLPRKTATLRPRCRQQRQQTLPQLAAETAGERKQEMADGRPHQ